MVYSDIDDVTGDDDNIVIDVRAAGVCFPDLLLTKGEYQLKLPPPFVPGMETAGVVRSAPETSGFQVGERVSAFGVLGGYAERVAVPVGNVVRSPAELDDAQAVSLLVNYNTMYFALARRAAMRPGDSVLVLGAAGGVGTAAIQIARAMDASQVIAMVHRDGAADYVVVARRRRGVAVDRRLGREGARNHPRSGRGHRRRSNRRTDFRRRDTRAGDRRQAAGDRLRCGRHPLRQGQPVAAAQRQRGGRGVGRVPQQGSRFGGLVLLRAWASWSSWG